MRDFCHLHCHTQYSLLDGAAKIEPLLTRTQELGMQALAITDHGNMFGVPHFISAAQRKGIKPIVGCEFYLAEDMLDRKEKKRYHQLLLAKNKEGYVNLTKLSSLSYTQGYYYKPRIDKRHLRPYAKGLIATTCCLGAEIPQAILHKGKQEAERLFIEWLDIFGEDYYVELQRHDVPEMDKCNAFLLELASKYNVPVIATNDVHYIDQEDSIAHDMLLCVQMGKSYEDPKRMRFPGDQFFLKSPTQMAELFKDLPQALDNTLLIVDKVKDLSLDREILYPNFPLPEGFDTQGKLLRHLTQQGALRRYGQLSEKVKARIEHELEVIIRVGYPGYFLIVQDLIQAAKRMGVMVGPGRGSAAGSAVAYCLGITEVDPIHYDLLFERFLNEERISPPDIDIDFDDEGRARVIEYVVKKYGHEQVAQIITFGSMAAKSSIKDVARVLEFPLAQANALAKLVPEKPGMTFGQAFDQVPELKAWQEKKESTEGHILSIASKLEGLSRHTGLHAAGIIIAPDKLEHFLPVKTDKQSELLVTQYDGRFVEQVGMLKMDFLGLKTLSIVKDTLRLVEQHYGEQIDIEDLPLEDSKTFKLYQRGDTVGTFQFESESMRQWLIKLKPTHIEDLFAMNALFRPGPMKFIPNYIARKHGQEEVAYPHPALEELLKPTYGIMVYQEQIMQAAQVMAGYSLGQADILRKAMGKKKIEVMAQQRTIFMEGAKKTHGCPAEQAGEIFDTMARFAEYGFNRSHSVAYGYLAFQTGFLKAHYPAAYMAAVLMHNQHDISKVAFFIEEAARQGIQVLGPEINQSDLHFSIGQAGRQIRFGMGAIKGVGSAAVSDIVAERSAHGPFKDINDLIDRTVSCKVSRKMIEHMAMAGTFDGWEEYHRQQYVYTKEGEPNFIEQATKYAQKIEKERHNAQQSLFAMQPALQYGRRPVPPSCEAFTMMEQLGAEKEMLGFYLSGHPLDPFKADMRAYCNATTQSPLVVRKPVKLGGIITATQQRQTKTGNYFGSFTLEDYKGHLTLTLFGAKYRQYQHLLQVGERIFLRGVVRPRYGRQEELEIGVEEICLLAELRTKKTDHLLLQMALDQLEEGQVDQLCDLLTAHPGAFSVSLQLYAAQEDMKVHAIAQGCRVALSDELLMALEAFPAVAYQLVPRA